MSRTTAPSQRTRGKKSKWMFYKLFRVSNVAVCACDVCGVCPCASLGLTALLLFYGVTL